MLIKGADKIDIMFLRNMSPARYHRIVYLCLCDRSGDGTRVCVPEEKNSGGELGQRGVRWGALGHLPFSG
jgi:hypothetical protein